MPEFRQRLEAYDTHMRKLGRHIIRCIALSLDLPEDYFDDGYVKAKQFRSRAALRAEAVTMPRRTRSAPARIPTGARSPFFIRTISAGSKSGTPTANGSSATPIPGTFVINLGDMIRRWTNDLYSSTLHRVVNTSNDRHRYSIATFFNPHDEYRVACVPTCIETGDKAPIYPPCTVGEHIMEMMRKTYGLTA